jgi:hypothetical protein
MFNTPSLATLRYIGVRVMRRPVLKKIRSLESREEQKILLEYSIKSAFEIKYNELKDRIMKKEKQKRDVFIPVAKLSLLNSKIHLLNTTYHMSDFKSVMKLFAEIEKELKHV